MKVGFTTVTFRNKSVEEIYEIAMKSNIKNIEWGGDIHLPVNDFVTAKYIKDKSKAYGINNLSYGSYYKLGSCDTELFENICKTAYIINAEIVRIWLGEKSSKLVSDFEFDKLVAEAKTLCKIATKYNIIVAFEFHKNTYNDNAKSCIKFIETCGENNLKTYWQPLGDYKEDLKNLKAVANHLITVHVFNWTKSDRRKLLYKGRRKWVNYIEIIKELGLKVNYVLEFCKGDEVGNFIRDVEFLNFII